MDHDVYVCLRIITSLIIHWCIQNLWAFLIFHSIIVWWLVGINKFFLSTKSLSLHHFWGVERLSIWVEQDAFFTQRFSNFKKRDPKHVCPRIALSLSFRVAISLVFPLFEGWPVSLIRFPATMVNSSGEKPKKHWNPGQDGVFLSPWKPRVPGGL